MYIYVSRDIYSQTEVLSADWVDSGKNGQSPSMSHRSQRIKIEIAAASFIRRMIVGKESPYENYLTANRTDASVNLHVDSEIPLALLLMLGLDVNPLHFRVENLDVVQLEARVEGRRRDAPREIVQIVHHRSVALSASTHRSRVAHRVSFVERFFFLGRGVRFDRTRDAYVQTRTAKPPLLRSLRARLHRPHDAQHANRRTRILSLHRHLGNTRR